MEMCFKNKLGTDKPKFLSCFSAGFLKGKMTVSFKKEEGANLGNLCFQRLHTVQGPGRAAKRRQAGSGHGSASSRLHCGQQVSCRRPQPVLLQERGRWSISWKKNKKGLSGGCRCSWEAVTYLLMQARDILGDGLFPEKRMKKVQL